MKKYIYYVGAFCIGMWMLAYPFLTMEKQYDEQAYQTVIEQVLDLESMPRQDLKFIRRNYQLQQEEYEFALVYAKESTMDVEEIAIIQGKDELQANHIEEQLRKHIEKQKKIFEGYGTDQMQLLESAQVMRKQQTVFVIISKEPTQMMDILQQMQ